MYMKYHPVGCQLLQLSIFGSIAFQLHVVRLQGDNNSLVYFHYIFLIFLLLFCLAYLYLNFAVSAVIRLPGHILKTMWSETFLF